MKKNLSRNIFHPEEVNLSPLEFQLQFQKREQEKTKSVSDIKKKELEELSQRKKQMVEQIETLHQKHDLLREEMIKEKKDQQHFLSDEKEFKARESKRQEEEILKQAQKKADEILVQANQESQKIIEKSKQEEEKNLEINRKTGYEEGWAQGYEEGKQERKRVEVFLKKILNETIKKRDQLSEQLQQHLIDVILLIARKVVKKIAEKDEGIVIENIKECLKKVQGPIQVTIRVNISDLKKVSKFKSKLTSSLNSLKQVDLIEDPTVDPGGCIVETDFALIDGKITSQLEKIEKIIMATKLV